jgi:Mg/Co/Ni transporter MgtE
VSEAAQLAMGGNSGILPVVERSLRLLGVVPVESLANALRWDPHAKIDTLVRQDFVSVSADSTLSQVFARLRSVPQQVFPVTNTAGELVGLLAREDVATALGVMPQGNK